LIERNLARDLNLEVGQGNKQQKCKVFHELRMFYQHTILLPGNACKNFSKNCKFSYGFIQYLQFLIKLHLEG
jgi:hypothetical protein